MSRLTPYLFALGTGVLMAASVPPVGFWPLGLVGIGALGALGAGAPAGRRAVLGLVAGIGLYGITLVWLVEFNAIGALAVIVLEAAFLGLATLLTPPGPARVLAWPAALVVTNAVRGAVPFGGLPMGGIDLGQAAGPLAPAARLGGPLAVIALVAVCGLVLEALTRIVLTRRRARVVGAAAIGAATVAFLAIGAGAIVGDGPATGTLVVALVQGGGQRGLRAIEHPPIEVYDAQLAAEQLVQPPVDVVLWPENTVALDGPLVASQTAKQLGAEARRLHTTLVVGVTEPVGATRFRNAAVAFAPDGTIAARYNKVHRVPFGEYIPFRALISHLVNLDVVPRDAIPGRGPGLLRTPAGPLGVVVSYEVFFPARARAAIAAGGQVLLVPTNTASYTTSQVPDAEIATARLRAWETGRDVAMVSPTGVSALIDDRGRVLARSGLGERRVLTATLTRRRGLTPYVRFGDGPWVLAALVVMAAAWAATRVGAPRVSQDPPAGRAECAPAART